jgi:hypothetical protein
MILLGTNVMSEAMKSEPAPSVRALLKAQAAETLHLSSATIADLLFGIGALPKGRRKDKLTAAFDGVPDLFGKQILPFNTSAAGRYCCPALRPPQMPAGDESRAAQLNASAKLTASSTFEHLPRSLGRDTNSPQGGE